MALFRKPRRSRNGETPKAGRREGRPTEATQPLLEQLRSIASQGSNPEDALEPALRAIVESTGAVAGALCLFDSRHSVLRLSAEVGLTDEGCRRLRTVRRGDPSCWDIPLHGVVNRRAYLIENASQNRYVPALIGRQVGMRTIACIPVYSAASPLASLVLVSAPPRSFGERDITLLWKPLRELATMIEAVRRQVAPTEETVSARGPMPIDLLALSAERDRLRTEMAGRAAEFERLTAQLTTNREDLGRLHAALEAAVAERGEIARELERLRTASEDTTALSTALADAERERQRLAEALEAAARDAAVREERVLAQARRDAEVAAQARESEWEAVKRSTAEQVAAVGRVAEERAAEIARLTARLGEVEVGAVVDRGRDQRREGEIVRLSAALEAAASRETDLRARLAAREAERIGAVDSELDAARTAVQTAEAGRARAEERATSIEAELQALKGMLDEVHGELKTAREEIVRLRDVERHAVAEIEQQRTTIAEALTGGTEARARLEVMERRLADLTAEHDRTNDDARGYQAALAQSEARVETVAAERDQLREALARSEAECARLHEVLGAAQTQDARVEGELAREREEQTLLTVRLAETEAAVARLEAITTSQQNELIERDAEILRLTAELAERERRQAEDAVAPTSVPVETADLDVIGLVAPELSATVTSTESGVTVINVRTVESEPEFVPTGAPVVVVLDGDASWAHVGIEGYDVAVIRPGTHSVSRIVELEPVRIIANLATPGALTALLAMRAGGSTTRFLGCVADPSRDRAIALSAIEPVVGPIDPDAIMNALGAYAGRDGRVVTTGTDVDALMSLRQALSRRKASVAMAWDAKQVREMLGVVKPHAIVVDMSMPKRDGCAILAALSGLDPVPLAVLVVAAGDPAQDFASLIAEPPHGLACMKVAEVLTTLATMNDEALPQVKAKVSQKLRVAHAPHWVG